MSFTKKNILILLAALSFLIVAIVIVKTFASENKGQVYTVNRENFEEVITCKGEINSASVVEINLPYIFQNQREIRNYISSAFKILNLVNEGTNVKKGSFVAQLDPSDIISQMRSFSQDLEKTIADLNNAKIDSTVRLTQLREEIIDAELDLQYNKIDLETSVYESEAYQRKVRMNYQKAEIAIEKKRRDYQLEKNKLKVGIMRQEDYVLTRKKLLDKFKLASDSCIITSPDEGIVMLAKSPLEGRKYKRDDYIYSFMPLLAVLPNMAKANSMIYVKEIDISKIAVGDSARITFDALEGVTLKGVVTWKNSLSETHKDYDMKVFKVYIYLLESNPGLKPAMSSNNDIIVNNLKNVLTIPVNSIFSENGDSYVYLKKGRKISKRKVVTGPENNESIVITEGLTEGDQILIESPKEVELKKAKS